MPDHAPGSAAPLDIPDTIRQARAAWAAREIDQAEIACQRVLAFWPGQTDASHLMGLMAHRHGNLDLAITHLRRACEAPRAPAVYHSDLAEMCRQAGLLDEAETMGRRAVTLDPRLAGAWNNLGIILQEAGKLEESHQALERALALEPGNPGVHNNIGNTCKRLGLTQDAERHWSRAIALRPHYAEVYSNLANLLTDRGEYDRARDLAVKAIELNPRLADAYINLAGVETALHAWSAAQRWLRALLAFAPDHAGGLVALAQTLKQLDEPDAAIEAARRAVSLAPQSAEAQNALGVALQAGGQDDLALAAFERAAALPGTMREQALINQAGLHLEFGRAAAAEAAYVAIVAEFPRSATALFNLTAARKTRAGDPCIDQMRALLADAAALSHTHRILLEFGLGKALLDAGDSEEAFRHLDEGNRMKRAMLSYDPAAVSQWMRDIAAAFPAAGLAAPGQSRVDAVRPVFVVGMPRSGTTLVEQILASHPMVHGAGELRYLQKIVDGAGLFPAAIDGLSADRLSAMGDSYMAHIRPLARGAAFVVDKMPANFLHIGLIRRILPDALIIHCRRDPVDTCLSCYSQLFAGEQPFTYDQTELGRFHRDYQTLMEHWRSGLPESRFLEVDYESVVEDLEGQARRMVSFLELPWDDACLEFHETKRPVRTASVSQVRQPIYRTSTGRWRKHAAGLRPLLEALGVNAV